MSTKYLRLRNKSEEFFKKSEFVLMVLGFFYLGIYSAEVLLELPASFMSYLEAAGIAIYLIFLLDLVMRFVVRIPELREFSGWVSFIKENWLSIFAAIVPAFRSLRVLRVLIVLRGFAPYLITRTQKVSLIVGVTLPLVLYTSALAVYEAERNAVDSNIQSFGDAIWWSLVSVTTVGYGDSFPVTSEGRAVAGLLMFVGIGLFSSLTALLAAWVVEGNRKAPTE
jgi:voltage-gated potassium channel